MKFIAYPRYRAEAMEDPGVPYAVVSISTPGHKPADIPRHPSCKGVIQLQFFDVDRLSGKEQERPITMDQAREIWRFFDGVRNDIQLLVCHCDMGSSRSAAVAAALAKSIGNDDSWFFEYKTPNRRVYRAVMCASEDAAGNETFS